MSRVSSLLFGLAAVLGAPLALQAQATPTADQDGAAVLARVLQPINVLKQQDLDFGDVFRSGGAKVINPGLVNQAVSPGADGQRGYFTVESSRDQGVQLTFTLVQPLLIGGTGGPNEELTVTAPQYCLAEEPGACATTSAMTGVAFLAPAFSQGDNTTAAVRHVYVGGTVEAGQDQRLGSYLGSLTLRAEYAGL